MCSSCTRQLLGLSGTDKHEAYSCIMQPSERQLPLDSCQLDQMDPNLLTTMSQMMQDTSTLYDPNFTVLDNASAPISIPKTYLSSHDDLTDFVCDPLSLGLMAATSDLELDETLSSSFGALGEYTGDLQSPLSPSLWSAMQGNDLKSADFLASAKADPTLAELNLKRDQSLLDSFVEEFDLPMLSPEEASTNITDSFDIPKSQWVGDKITNTKATGSSTNEVLSSSFPVIGFKESVERTPVPCNFSTMWNEQLKEKDQPDQPTVKQESKPISTLHDLLTQHRTNAQFKSLPVAAESKSSVSSPLSSSAPTLSVMEDRAWKTNPQTFQQTRQDQRAESCPTSETSATVSEVFKSNDDVDSHDEGFDSEPEDTDHYDELTSDAESTISDDFDSKRSKSLNNSPTKHFKKEKFFWQYNVQAKGPKISRLCLSPNKSDPHHLNKITDPVFSPGCYIQGIKHSGKARRGDGNDLNPNARKLFQIGQELRKLNRVINDLTPVSELPFNARPRSRKEKNKLASRACRLKKKAQHEANKLKLYGLEDEHSKLAMALDETRKLIVERVQDPEKKFHCDAIYDKIEILMKENMETKVAGCTSEYVNRILGSISEGKPFDEIEEK